MSTLQALGFNQEYDRFFAEDDLQGNAYYLNKLPIEKVSCTLKLKSDLTLSGLPYFLGAFNYLGADIENENEFLKSEGKDFSKGQSLDFDLPFHIALSGERVALNLLQQSTRITTFTKKFVEAVSGTGIKILDTRKTTPGLRTLEKYAVRVGGGHNHRFSQADAWMIKDNHKAYFGGLPQAWNYFQSMQTFYQNIIVEIHSLQELELAIELGVSHVMLDNFSSENLKQAVRLKNKHMSFEVSGGVTLENIKNYLIEGIDAISIGALTHSAPHVDISMKIKPAGTK